MTRAAHRLATLLLTVTLVAACAAPGTGKRHGAPERNPANHHLILVSIDGFGHDLQARTRTPALDAIAVAGVQAKRLRPVFPAMTFPNHYSIATGRYPAEHGIVDNSFPDAARERWYSLSDREAVGDGSWYGGEPIWVTAEKNGQRSAAFFFVGTEARIAGYSPRFWYRYDEAIAGERRVEKALEWLALPPRGRPHLITLYFEDVDDASHDYGPHSPQALAAVRKVDEYLATLRKGIRELGLADRTHLVVVSDHGQAPLREDAPPFVLADHVPLDGLTIKEHTSYLAVYLHDDDGTRAATIRDAINAEWQHGRAYLRSEAPAHWRVADDGRYADVFAIAEPGYAVVSSRKRYVKKGNHGYDPGSEPMQGIFLAEGPRLPAGRTIDAVHAVDIYPLLTALLELPLPDGFVPAQNDLRQHLIAPAASVNPP